MSHFANPLKVTAMPATWSVRISVRASDTRIDEWSITASDVQSVLTRPDGTGWRGDGELRVLLDHTGGSVAFHSTSGDRAIIRGPESMIHSFLAHLQAAYDQLPGSAPEQLPTSPAITKYFPYSYGSAPSESSGMQEVLNAIQCLSDAVRTALAASPAPQPMIQSVGVPTFSESVFIPSVLTTVEGTGLVADEKTSGATDLAAAAAALKSVMKKNTPQEIP